MTKEQIYQIWAPIEVPWSKWVRPVLFACLEGEGVKELINEDLPQILYEPDKIKNAAIVLDLPADDGIKEGIALTEFGFRPVPLYNGTDAPSGAMSLVSNEAIKNALIIYADQLKAARLKTCAPPAFLLDSNRTLRYKMEVSVFDNSWDIYPQDLPSAEFLLSHQIDKIIVQTQKLQKDMRIVLHKYQQKGIKILLTDGLEKPKEVSIKKPLRQRI